jgi:hypothetical protein
MENLNFQIKKIDQNEILAEIKHKNTHIIFPALESEHSNAFHFLVNFLGLSSKEFIKYVGKINTACDVGCFFPQYPISMMPEESIIEMSTSPKKNMDDIIGECFSGNEEYLKCETMIFCVDDQTYNEDELARSIRLKFQDLSNRSKMYVKNVFVSFNSK